MMAWFERRGEEVRHPDGWGYRLQREPLVHNDAYLFTPTGERWHLAKMGSGIAKTVYNAYTEEGDTLADLIVKVESSNSLVDSTLTPYKDLLMANDVIPKERIVGGNDYQTISFAERAWTGRDPGNVAYEALRERAGWVVEGQTMWNPDDHAGNFGFVRDKLMFVDSDTMRPMTSPTSRWRYGYSPHAQYKGGSTSVPAYGSAGITPTRSPAPSPIEAPHYESVNQTPRSTYGDVAGVPYHGLF